MNWNKRLLSLGKSLTSNYSGERCVLYSMDCSGNWCKSLSLSPCWSVGNHELHGELRERSTPACSQCLGTPWHKNRVPRIVPAGVGCFLCSFSETTGETQLESSTEKVRFVVLATSKGVSSRKSFSGHFTNTFIWQLISCERSLLWNSLISLFFCVVWKEE